MGNTQKSGFNNTPWLCSYKIDKKNFKEKIGGNDFFLFVLAT